MRPFKLTISEEIFLETYNIDEEWPCGAFSYQVKFFKRSQPVTISDKEENTISEWLSFNCKKNFIFCKNASAIIAGVYANNMLVWKSQRNLDREPIVEYKIRLYKEDVWLFRMVWID